MMELEEDEGQDQQTLSHLNETKQEKGQQLDKVLVKDESYIVTERKGLPVEVQQAISLAGQSRLFLLPLTDWRLSEVSEVI